ncbi:lysoplasmalogenase family protein [Altererythrobacter sp.]|uniref:lysoplasmalogenase family protein n=1 Tax=Altererythrobacter sp. TaxID=1872480 RepID=UPI003D0093DD
MPKRALVNHRPWLLAALIAAVAFYFLRDAPFPEAWLILVKGAAVAALAAYAYRRGVGNDSLILTLVMALSAAGDMAIELSLEAGGFAFFLSHLAAISLYLRHPRHHVTGSQKALAVALLLGTPLICWFLARDYGVALYGLSLGGMASTAWMSRFPRYRVGLGAVMFVISDFLIFSRLGPIDLGDLPHYLIWPLYFIGQFLIATGVTQVLRHELAEEDE